jgi:hypothetical protein
VVDRAVAALRQQLAELAADDERKIVTILFGAIQVARVRKNLTAKSLAQQSLHFRVAFGQLARGLIGIKIFGAGKISRRQSQKVDLPVEMPPVIPMTGTVLTKL